MKRVEFRVERRHDPSSLERLAIMLNRAMQGPERAVDAMQWEFSGEEGLLRFQFPLGPGPAAKKNTCAQVGRVLADFTLCEHEPEMLRKWFQSHYGFEDDMELDALVAETVALLDEQTDQGQGQERGEAGSHGREKRRNKLAAQYAQYLAKHHRLHVDGFIRFRLGEYRQEVLKAAETAAENRVMMQQYEAFINMVKTQVDLAHIGISAVHVLHAGGHAFRLLDEDMRPLDRVDADQGMSAETEESLLVSRLLAVSPGQLHIHTPEPESKVIQTLIGIFGDRAALHPHHP